LSNDFSQVYVTRLAVVVTNGPLRRCSRRGAEKAARCSAPCARTHNTTRCVLAVRCAFSQEPPHVSGRVPFLNDVSGRPRPKGAGLKPPKKPEHSAILWAARDAWNRMEKYHFSLLGKQLSFPKVQCAGPQTIVLLTLLGLVVTRLVLSLVHNVSRCTSWLLALQAV
jgi:hypothetical protein